MTKEVRQLNSGEHETDSHYESLSIPAPRSTLYIEIFIFGAMLPAAMLWFVEDRWLHLALWSLVLGPLMLGLRYGFFAGSGGAVLTAGALAWIVLMRPETLGEFPRAQAVSLLMVGMGSGRARDFWEARIRRLGYLCQYHQRRLAQLTSGFRLLQVSHAQLERQAAGGTVTLRSALQRLRLRPPVTDGSGQNALGGTGEWLLEIMAEAGNLHTAAVYELNERGILQFPPVASAGKVSRLSRFNPLLRETLRTGMLTSISAVSDAPHADVIAVVPLVDTTGHIHGIVSINDMPFININQHTFELLGVLGRHLGDILMSRTRPVSEKHCPYEFQVCLQRSLLDARNLGLPAALVACSVVDTAHREALVARCCQNGRGLDQSWISIDRKGQPVILRMLPLTDEAGARSYLHRLESEQTDACAGARGITTQLWMLDRKFEVRKVLAEIGDFSVTGEINTRLADYMREVPEAFR